MHGFNDQILHAKTSAQQDSNRQAGCLKAMHAEVRLLQAIWRLDYAGIVILIVASFIPAVYYGFLCQAHLRTFYITITAVLGMPAYV